MPCAFDADFDYSLATGSPYKAGGAQAADNGGDLGLSTHALRAALGDVRGVSVNGVGTTQALFRYTTFDGQPCTLDLSPTATFSTNLRFVDPGGARTRYLTATGLTAGTLYNWRLHCGTTTSGSFHTQSAASGARSIEVSVKPPANYAVDHAIVEYGSTAVLGTTSAPVACANGCTISIPGVASQALYYRVQYRKPDTEVIATSAGHVVIP